MGIATVSDEAEILMDKFKRELINTAITEFACEVIWIYGFLLLGTLRWLVGTRRRDLLLSNKIFMTNGT